MALNTFECNYLTPLHFKGLITISMEFTATVLLQYVSVFDKRQSGH